MYAAPKTTAEDKALFKRAAAARELAERGVLDGAAGLGFALWPTRAIEEASARSPDDQPLSELQKSRSGTGPAPCAQTGSP